jgi:hypothetical protein
MKNIELVTEPDEIHGYMRKLWRTDEFRRSHDEGGFVHQIVDEFAGLPRFFFDISDPVNEPSHFSAWWSGIQKREYDNKAVHDLYYAHELTHAGTLIYMPGLEYNNFTRKMHDNELVASTRSEIQAYFEMPTLRAQSFPQEIFADRFLKDKKIQERWEYEPQRVTQELALRRRNVMMTSQAPNDVTEFWIHKFAYQNDGWASIWFDRYNEVETGMTQLRDDCRTMGRKPAMEKFMGWLTSPEVMQGTDTPFPDEAKAFAGIYWKNKRLYQAAYEKSAQPAVAPAARTPEAQKHGS